MKHILLFIIFIILFKLSLLFTPLSEGLWSISTIFAIIWVIFLVYLLFQLKNLEIKRNSKLLIFLGFLIFVFITYQGWTNLHVIQKTNYDLKVEASIINNKTDLRNDIYNILLNSLNRFNKSASKQTLKDVFLKNTDFADKNSNYPIIKSKNPNLVIFASDISADIISLVGIDTTGTGKLTGFKNFNNSGEGYIQYKATLTLGGVSYERQN